MIPVVIFAKDYFRLPFDVSTETRATPHPLVTLWRWRHRKYAGIQGIVTTEQIGRIRSAYSK